MSPTSIYGGVRGTAHAPAPFIACARVRVYSSRVRDARDPLYANSDTV